VGSRVGRESSFVQLQSAISRCLDCCFSVLLGFCLVLSPGLLVSCVPGLLQSEAAASADLFISPNDAVSSLLVVPFQGCLSPQSSSAAGDVGGSESGCIGALYLSHTSPSEFSAALPAATSIAQLLQYAVPQVIQYSRIFSGSRTSSGIEVRATAATATV
jgi:hypothetical protein